MRFAAPPAESACLSAARPGKMRAPGRTPPADFPCAKGPPVRFRHVCIESIVHHLPERVVTSSEIESMLAPVYERLRLPFGRLELITGIRERRFWEPGTRPSEVAAVAGRLALERAGIDPADIGCLIHSSVCRDFLEPATASVIHAELGLADGTMIFDLSNACLGFLNAMTVVGGMIESGLIKAALVVTGENGRPLVESTVRALLSDPALTRAGIKNQFASLTIGCGAAAAVLTHESLARAGHRLLGGVCLVSSQFNHLCRGGAGGAKSGRDSGFAGGAELLMETDAEALLVAGCHLARRTWGQTLELLEIEAERVSRFFCHQVGSIHRRTLFETLGIDLSKDFETFPFLGNMGSASLPVTLSLGAEAGAARAGEMLALLGIGSGINCMMLGVKW